MKNREWWQGLLSKTRAKKSKLFLKLLVMCQMKLDLVMKLDFVQQF